MLKDEVGDSDALTACHNIVKSELLLMNEGKLLLGKFPWFRVNPLSKRLEFAHLESRFSDVFDQTWRMNAIEHRKPDDEKQPVGPDTPLKGTPKAKAKARAAAGQKRGATDPDNHEEVERRKKC